MKTFIRVEMNDHWSMGLRINLQLLIIQWFEFFPIWIFLKETDFSEIVYFNLLGRNTCNLKIGLNFCLTKSHPFFPIKINSSFLLNIQLGFNAPHDRNENSSPSSAMLAHPQQHQPVSQSSMSYNVQVNSAHKNISSSSTSTGAYSIQNMKEEPNAGANNYSSAVNGSGADDMAVSTAKRWWNHQWFIFHKTFWLILGFFSESAEFRYIHTSWSIWWAGISFTIAGCTESTTVFRK